MTKTYQETQQDRQTTVCVIATFIALTAFVLVAAFTISVGKWVGVVTMLAVVLLHTQVPRPFRCLSASTIMGAVGGYLIGLSLIPYFMVW